MARNKAGFSINSLDPRLLAAAGRVDGVTSIVTQGVNAAVGTAYEDVWIPGGTLVHLTAATVLELASSDNTQDKAAGAGALTVQIRGWDGDYAELNETMTMNGTTMLTTTGLFLGVNSARVLTAGSELDPKGIIDIADDATTWVAGVNQDATKTVAYLPAGAVETQQAFYMVPAGFTGYLTGVHVTPAPGKTITYRLRAYDFAGSTERTVHEGVVPDGIELDKALPFIPIAEKTLLRLQAKVSATTALVAGGFEMTLIDNSKV